MLRMGVVFKPKSCPIFTQNWLTESGWFHSQNKLFLQWDDLLYIFATKYDNSLISCSHHVTSSLYRDIVALNKAEQRHKRFCTFFVIVLIVQIAHNNTLYWQLPTRGFSVTIYNSRGNQIDIAQIAIYNCFVQIKSNVGFWWEGKTGVPGEKPLIAE